MTISQSNFRASKHKKKCWSFTIHFYVLICPHSFDDLFSFVSVFLRNKRKSITVFTFFSKLESSIQVLKVVTNQQAHKWKTFISWSKILYITIQMSE